MVKRVVMSLVLLVAFVAMLQPAAYAHYNHRAKMRMVKAYQAAQK